MAFQQGLSGLGAASQQLDVISNNISNSSNIGFKQAGAIFSDVFAASLGGISGGSQIGIGTAVGGVKQLFSQGNVTSTSNPMDLAINGGGFFELRSADGSDVAYSRNGQFEVDKNGYIVNSSGFQLCGYTAASPSTSVPLNVNVASALIGSPKSTDTVGMALKLSSKAKGVDLTVTAPATGPSKEQLTNANVFTTSVSIYDTKGGSHVVTMYFAKDQAENATNPQPWHIFTSFDGGDPVNTTQTMVFDTSGNPVDPATGNPINPSIDITFALPATANFALGPTAAAAGAPAVGDIRFNFEGSKEYGNTFNVASLSQNGYQEGILSNISVNDTGVIEANFSNGQKSSLGTVVLATFAYTNGLASMGNNMWTSTYESGDPLVDRPGIGARGAIQAQAVESSNVDLTSELVNMITAQRNYQANAQSIKTQDSIMQTLVNLR